MDITCTQSTHVYTSIAGVMDLRGGRRLLQGVGDELKRRNGGPSHVLSHVLSHVISHVISHVMERLTSTAGMMSEYSLIRPILPAMWEYTMECNHECTGI